MERKSKVVEQLAAEAEIGDIVELILSKKARYVGILTDKDEEELKFENLVIPNFKPIARPFHVRGGCLESNYLSIDIARECIDRHRIKGYKIWR